MHWPSVEAAVGFIVGSSEVFGGYLLTIVSRFEGGEGGNDIRIDCSIFIN